MSDDKPDDQPTPATNSEAAPSDGQRSGGKSEQDAAPTRDQALNNLRSGGPELSGVRFGKIVAEANSRLEGVSTVNIFHGDFSVDGDFVAGPGGRPAARGATKVRLPADELVESTEYFVPPPDFDAGVALLSDTNLLVLSGPSGTGRYTRAVATLREVMPDTDVFRLHGSVLGNPTWRVPQERSGLLVVDSPGGNGKYAAEKVTNEWLAKTSERLAESDSFLVVVTGPVQGELATAARRMEFVLEDLELPDPMDIIRRRLAGEIPWAADGLDERLTTAGLPEVVGVRDDPRFAARAATAILEAIRAERDLAEVVAKLNDPEEEVRAWLSRDPELSDVALVLATAVLEGASYLNVADAAVALYRDLGGGAASLNPRYLRKLIAERGWIQLVTASEERGAPLLKFTSARMRAVVLAVMWFELDGARTKTLGWLRKLAEHTDVDVRARAAQAAGILADNDFEHGVHHYLLPWGTARSPLLRQSAAHGLNAAAVLGRHTESAWSYVEQWAEFTNDGVEHNLAATAGLAAGGQLGVRNPRRALRVLRTLVCDGDWSLLAPVAVSTQTLLEEGRGDEVLGALLEWTEPAADEQTVVKALTMFAFAVKPEDTADDWPLLMRTANAHRQALPELWGRALANGSVRDLAMDALRSWVRIADQDEKAVEMVLDIVAGIADRGRNDFDRLQHALHGWAVDRDDPSDVAIDFYNELVDAESEAEVGAR